MVRFRVAVTLSSLIVTLSSLHGQVPGSSKRFANESSVNGFDRPANYLQIRLQARGFNRLTDGEERSPEPTFKFDETENEQYVFAFLLANPNPDFSIENLIFPSI